MIVRPARQWFYVLVIAHRVPKPSTSIRVYSTLADAMGLQGTGIVPDTMTWTTNARIGSIPSAWIGSAPGSATVEIHRRLLEGDSGIELAEPELDELTPTTLIPA
jgi:hypothetical protein